MKALLFHEHGTTANIHYTDIPKPQIGDDEILLKVKAAALNRLDLWVLEGWPGLNLKFPHIMGSDGSGIISEIGRNVSGYSIGDRVAVNPTLSCNNCHFCRMGKDNMCVRFALMGEHVDGFFAEYASIPQRNLLKLPDHVSFVQAAAASLVFVTAWHSLITRGGLQAGESVLIIGAGGGVNTAALQVARLAGAFPIIVVGSSAQKLAKAQDLGADIVLNRHEENWGKRVFQATNRQGVDVVVDNVGLATYNISMRCLKRGGRLLTVGNTSGAKFEFDNRYIFAKHLNIIGSTMGPSSDFNEVMQIIFDGRLTPIIDSIYPLQEGIAALQKLEKGDFIGKIVLEPSV